MPRVVRKDRRILSRAIPLPTPVFNRGGITLYHGDSLDLLRRFEPAIADALVTDPPYSSGGLLMTDRLRDPTVKYCHNAKACGRPSFAGDMRDQRSFFAWATLWALLARRLVKPDGYGLIFTDWRQLPTMTDVLQASGFIWRGVIAWDKGRGARAPHKGYFRHQCEYIAWGTNGRCTSAPDGPWDGCYQESVRQVDKFHMTGKPTALMQKLVRCAPAGGLVLDCFAGSGTTGVACAMTGRRFIGFEQSPEYCAIAAERFATTLEGHRAA